MENAAFDPPLLLVNGEIMTCDFNSDDPLVDLLVLVTPSTADERLHVMSLIPDRVMLVITKSPEQGPQTTDLQMNQRKSIPPKCFKRVETLLSTFLDADNSPPCAAIEDILRFQPDLSERKRTRHKRRRRAKHGSAAADSGPVSPTTGDDAPEFAEEA